MSKINYDSPCPKLEAILEKTKSKAAAKAKGIVDSIPGTPTSGTAGGIGAKIAASVKDMKEEAEKIVSDAKAAAGKIEQTLMDFVTDVENKIEDLREQMENASQEIIEELQGRIDALTDSINEKIPSWLNKTPEELLQDVKSGICDPDVSDLGVPEEGAAKDMIPATTPVDNPTTTTIEGYQIIETPGAIENPIRP